MFAIFKKKKLKLNTYCENIKCPIALLINTSDPVIQVHKEHYQSRCEGCEVFKFKKWLKENKYQIIEK